MIKYKLIDAISVPLTISVASKKDGYVRYGYTRLEPHKWYEVPEGDDVLLTSLKNAKSKKGYSVELENLLSECGADYKVEYCQSCGGKVRKIEYYVIEVVENE